MGRYYWDKKTEADSLKKIQTWFLKKHGYFDKGVRSGTVTWTRGWSENKQSVGIQSEILDTETYIRIYYTQTDTQTGEKKDFDHKYPLVTTPCYFGGKRYWFICSVYKSGVYCGRRVAVLYKDGDYFACRHCYNLSYESRNLGGIFKSVGKVISIPDIEEQERNIKRKYYAGKMTKKYLKLLKTRRKSYFQMATVAKGLGEEF